MERTGIKSPHEQVTLGCGGHLGPPARVALSLCGYLTSTLGFGKTFQKSSGNFPCVVLFL